MKIFCLLLALALFYAGLANAAGFKGEIAFTPEEKAIHLQNVPVILQVAAECIQQNMERHKAFIHKYGISAFYGSRSSFAKLTTADKKSYMHQTICSRLLLGKWWKLIAPS